MTTRLSKLLHLLRDRWRDLVVAILAAVLIWQAGRIDDLEDELSEVEDRATSAYYGGADLKDDIGDLESDVRDLRDAVDALNAR